MSVVMHLMPGSPVVMLHLWFHVHLMVATRQAPSPPPPRREIKNCWENNEGNLLIRPFDLRKTIHIQNKTRKSIFYVLKWQNGFIYDQKESPFV